MVFDRQKGRAKSIPQEETMRKRFAETKGIFHIFRKNGGFFFFSIPLSICVDNGYEVKVNADKSSSKHSSPAASAGELFGSIAAF